MTEASSINSITVGMFSFAGSALSHNAHSRTISIWCMPRWNTLKALAAYDRGICAASTGL